MHACEPTKTPGHRHRSDVELLEAVLGRDEQAWRELLNRYRRLIYRCIHKIARRYEACMSFEDVDEIFGDVCINLLRDDMRKLRAYDSTRGARLGSWLGMIAINTAYDYLRVSRRRPMLDKLDTIQEWPAPGPTALEVLLERERRHRLVDLMEDCSDKDRQFAELYYGRGLLPEEVAAEMQISVKTVYSKKNKLRSKLAELARREQRPANEPDDVPLAA